MKQFFAPYRVAYESYTFSYAVYALKEKVGELSEIYDLGFLPYSGDYAIHADIFYMARSLRVDLERFTDSSENRRVARKVEPLAPEMRFVPKDEFDLDDSTFKNFCTEYAKERFKGGEMGEDRIQYLLGREMLNTIVEMKIAGKVAGYIFLVDEGDTMHYWFSFFDVQYLANYNLGKWMMWKTISLAKEQGKRYVYLGTCYGKKSLYKVRDFKGVEFYDGMGWNQDASILKGLCKTDEEIPDADRFKTEAFGSAMREKVGLRKVDGNWVL